jgi:hypothetical protein
LSGFYLQADMAIFANTVMVKGGKDKGFRENSGQRNVRRQDNER